MKEVVIEHHFSNVGPGPGVWWKIRRDVISQISVCNNDSEYPTTETTVKGVPGRKENKGKKLTDL